MIHVMYVAGTRERCGLVIETISTVAKSGWHNGCARCCTASLHKGIVGQMLDMSELGTVFSKYEYRVDTLQFSCGFILSWCMHATKYQNLDGLNADDVLRAMWQKSRALIQKSGSLAPFAFSIQFQRCMIRLGRIKTARSKS